MQRARRMTPLHAAATALAVILGILAMHAVSGGPHSPRGVEHAMTGQALYEDAAAMVGMPEAGALMPSLQATLGEAASVVSGLAGPVADRAGLSAPAPADDMGAMAAMCAAVLLVLILALGFGLLGRAARPVLAARTLGTVPGRRPLPRAPPRDLLAELCVLRT